MVSCSSNKMNPKVQKKKPQIFFVQHPKQKWVPQKKSQKNFFCPFLPILDAAAKFLLIINSKHPTQKLGFRETLQSGWYFQICWGLSYACVIAVFMIGVIQRSSILIFVRRSGLARISNLQGYPRPQNLPQSVLPSQQLAVLSQAYCQTGSTVLWAASSSACDASPTCPTIQSGVVS